MRDGCLRHKSQSWRNRLSACSENSRNARMPLVLVNSGLRLPVLNHPIQEHGEKISGLLFPFVVLCHGNTRIGRVNQGCILVSRR